MTYEDISTYIISNKGIPELPPADRLVIAKLARKSQSGVINLADAAEVLGLDSRSAAVRLGSLARRGWLLRVRRGIYLIVPLEVEPGKLTTAADPWVVAEEVFRPCYIGGWSAAEYWDLTEQIFRSTLVVTAAPVRAKKQELLGQEYQLFRVPQARVHIDSTVWRDSVKVRVSSRERTIIDCLRNPELAGGIAHLVLMMKEYASKPERNFDTLLQEAYLAASGAVWKRLGYLSQLIWPEQGKLRALALKNIAKGNIKLDPSVMGRGKLSNQWGLWANVNLITHD